MIKNHLTNAIVNTFINLNELQEVQICCKSVYFTKLAVVHNIYIINSIIKNYVHQFLIIYPLERQKIQNKEIIVSPYTPGLIYRISQNSDYKKL